MDVKFVAMKGFGSVHYGCIGHDDAPPFDVQFTGIEGCQKTYARFLYPAGARHRFPGDHHS